MPKKSKRNALRWCCDNHVVTYKTAYDEGEARLINISANGCLLESLTLPLTIKEKFLISIKLDDKQQVIEAQAVVLRISEEKFAAKFILIEPETQSLVRSYFTQKLRNS